MTVRVIDFRTASTSPLNPLGSSLRQYIYRQVLDAAADPTVTALVLTGGPHHFSAGADLTEFKSLKAAFLSEPSSSSSQMRSSNTVPSLVDVVNTIEACDKPVVACIAGTCLGGGLEVALACHYRIASPNSSLGLPEVTVGVIPGAGGTQRLPALVGLQAALGMILSGKPVHAKRALELSILDQVVVAEQLLENAIKWAEWAALMPLQDRRLSLKKRAESPAVAHVTLQIASLSLPKRGGDCVRAALEAIRAGYTLSNKEAQARELECFLEALVSPQGQAIRHAFFAVRAAQKPLSTSLQHKIVPGRAAVIGAGTMGTGIALVLLKAGFTVTLVDIAKPVLDKGLATMRSILESAVLKKKSTAAAMQAQLARLQGTVRIDALEPDNCQLVVEAVVENMRIKQSIFRQLAQTVGKTCLLLSNTSTLDIDQIAAAVPADRQGLVAGWHFFSPAHVMKLVEIVVGKATSPQTVSVLQALTKQVGKIGVVVGNCDGFCGNRLLRPYQAETTMLLVEGERRATIESVDQALLDFGMAIGPFQLGDLAGNDVGYNIRRERGWVRDEKHPNPTNRPDRYTELADVMVSQYGRLGQKAGKGWYDYDPAIGKGRKPLPSAQVKTLIQSYMTTLPNSQANMSSEEIIQRVLYPLVNEGFKCLEEGVARSPSDIDVIYLFGYGFPGWRGGPMYWADHDVGLDVLLETLQRLSRQFPTTDHYVPSALLVECVRRNVTVEEYYASKKQARSKL